MRPRHVVHLPEHRSLTDAEAAAYTGAGFEIGLHLSTNCADWDDRAHAGVLLHRPARRIGGQLSRACSAPTTNRTHCIAWSDWATQPKVELQHGIRLDTNYYYWPAELGPGPPRHVHRLRHADALRRPRRHDDRRLPGGHPDDRRVRAVLPVHRSTRCSTAPSAPRATTASSPPTCTPTPLPQPARTRSSPRPRRAACRSSRPARC